MRSAVVVLAVAGAAACSDAMDGADAGPDAAACAPPSVDAPWLQAYLVDAIAQLSAAPRATLTERNAARAYLASALMQLGWQPQEHAYTTGANVYATIPATTGSAPELVVGAHFDSVLDSPGANDNASGTAIVLAIARFLAEAPCRTAPVTVILFDEEERGLFGSRAYAMTRDPSTIRAVHTIDQVAWDGDGDRLYEVEVPTPALEAEYQAAAQVVGATVVVTPVQGTDHQSFRERGFAAVGLTEEYFGGDTSPHRHATTDTPDTVDVPYLVLGAQLAAQVILTAATE